MPKVKSPLGEHIESTLQGVAGELAGAQIDLEAILSACDRLPVGIYCTTPGGELRYSNAALDKLLGYPSRSAHMEKTAPDIYQKPIERTQWQRDIEANGNLQRVITHARCADGRNVTVLDSGTVIRAPDGSVLYYLGFWESA